MAGKTISQRITLEGADDIKKKLEELGKTGEAAFKKLQDAGAQPIADTGQINQTRQALDALAATAENTSTSLISAANAWRLAALGIVASITAVTSALTKGAVDTGSQIAEQAAKLKLTVQEWMKLAAALDAAGVSQENFIKGAAGLGKALADAKGGFVEMVPGTLVSTLEGAAKVITDLATQIARLGNTAEAARQGTAAFGENWKEIVKALTAGKDATDAAGKSLAELGKANRAMSADQVEKAVKVKEAWEDLAKAVRATRDAIGALFLDSALIKTEWLTELVDGARELFRLWSQLGAAKSKAFMEELGTSPTELLFKTLVAVSEQLAGIWNDILVPAGKQLATIVKNLTGSLGEVSASQVTAFFITAAAAAIGLSIALRAVGLVLAPVSILLSLFTPFGAALIGAAAAAALFWDQLSAGAAKAAELIPESLQQILSSFQKLFAGDFAGFWAQFSEAAVAAMQTVGQAIMRAEGPAGDLVRSLVEGFKQIATDAPAALQTVLTIFVALGNAATAVAETINKIFGTELTGTDIALIVIVAQLTGGLAALAAIATTVGVAVSILGTAFGVLAAIIGGIPAAIVAITVALAGAAAAWLTFSDAGKAAVEIVVGAIDSVIEKLKEAGKWISSLFGGGGDAAAAIPGKARGGMIGGRGSGTSDSNLAWVSRGEHIMPARAVKQPGVLALLEALRRSGGNLRGVLDGMGRFAAGGVVPRFAEGGLVGAMGHLGTVDLRTDHGTVRLMAGSSAVEQLGRLAVTKRITSTGRKPGFVGG